MHAAASEPDTMTGPKLHWSYDESRRHTDLGDAARSMLHQLERRLYSFIAPHVVRQPHHLYHYTGDEAFEGILNSGGFRATYWRDLTDPKEIAYGMSVIDAVFQTLRSQLDTESLREMLGVHYYSFVSQEVKQSYYIACLTEMGDSLIHWTEYGRASGGCCLEIDPFKLRRACGGFAVELLPVTYEFKSQADLAIEIVTLCWKTTISLARATPQSTYQTWMPHVMALLNAHLHFHLRLMKTESYSWEREWRIVVSGPAPQARAADAPKRFVHLPLFQLSPAAVTGLVLGPGTHSLDAPRALRQHGYDDRLLRPTVHRAANGTGCRDLANA